MYIQWFLQIPEGLDRNVMEYMGITVSTRSKASLPEGPGRW